MSRLGYSDDYDNWALIKWRGQVASAIRGKRGQALLRDMLAALDAMPVKRLISEELVDAGDVCALGALGRQRGMDMTGMDPEWREGIASAFNIAEPLAAEIMFINDEVGGYWARNNETPEQRWTRVRQWVAEQIAGGK